MKKISATEKQKELVFTIIQDFLKNPPVVIWGSGATAGFGMPGMGALNECLKEKMKGFDGSSNNLEKELGDPKYESQMPLIRSIIWNEIKENDEKVLENFLKCQDDFLGIKEMIDVFSKPYPKILNIITTNYDRVLEHTMSYFNISYTDGFSGQNMSAFNEKMFDDKKITVKLVKVHGSLNWFDVNGKIRYSSQEITDAHKIIPPGKKKYEEAYKTPYRELIQQSDQFIKTGKSFFVVGFGFNDSHLTPEICNQVSSGVPIILVSKKITDEAKRELKNAHKYVFIEESSKKSCTRFYYKKSQKEKEETCDILGDFWKLKDFMENILKGEE